MKVVRNIFLVGDLVRWFEEGDLIVNRNYQRGGRLWPNNAKSYFIDTVLNGYPFPKVTIRQIMDLRSRKPIREIIDGQQRLTAIFDFVGNKHFLTSVSKRYRGMAFSDLDDDTRERFLSYEVSIDTIVAAQDEEVLEVFRRMNSYTLPLNDQEKRHATYQGEFKWFINDMIAIYSPMFEKMDILSVKQLRRMQDAELLSELCYVIMCGVEARSQSKLNDLYKNNDSRFAERSSVEAALRETLDYIKSEYSHVLPRESLTGYLLHSLFSALVFNRWGYGKVLPEEMLGLQPIDRYVLNDRASRNLLSLLDLPARDPNSEFARALASTTHSRKNRLIRMKWLALALQDHQYEQLLH